MCAFVSRPVEKEKRTMVPRDEENHDRRSRLSNITLIIFSIKMCMEKYGSD